MLTVENRILRSDRNTDKEVQFEEEMVLESPQSRRNPPCAGCDQSPHEQHRPRQRARRITSGLRRGPDQRLRAGAAQSLRPGFFSVLQQYSFAVLQIKKTETRQAILFSQPLEQ